MSKVFNLYPLIDRLMNCSHIKHPDRRWTTEFYYDCAFAWMGKEDQLEKRVIQLEKELGLSTESHSHENKPNI